MYVWLFAFPNLRDILAVVVSPEWVRFDRRVVETVREVVWVG